MKKIKKGLLVVLTAASFIACKKNDLPSNITLEATKTSSIKKGEPVMFTFLSAPSGTINWSINPSTSTQINTSGNQASILFGQKGNYIVTANSGNFTASKTVTVSDTLFTGNNGNNNVPPKTLPFSAGETIKITAVRIDSGAYSGLVFSALTSNSYNCLSSFLISTFTSSANSYGINYTGVSIPGDCTNGTSKAGAYSYLYPVAAGSNILTINFNGTTYTGTIVKSGNSYTIKWNYTTGVIISPTNL